MSITGSGKQGRAVSCQQKWYTEIEEASRAGWMLIRLSD
jgi:hypothetical protein